MNKTAEYARAVMRWLIITLCLSVILLSSLFIILSLPLGSHSFTAIVEHLIASRTGMLVELGSVRMIGGPVILLRNLALKQTDEEEPFLTLPSVEITVGLSMITEKALERIVIRRPKLFVNFRDEYSYEFGDSNYSVKEVSMDNGEVILQTREGTHHLSAVALSLKESGNNLSKLTGSLFIEDIHKTVPFSLLLDSKLFSIRNGHVEITLETLEEFSYQDITFLKGREIEGAMHLAVDFFLEKKLEVQLLSRLQNVSIQEEKKAPLLNGVSGEIEVVLTAGKNFEMLGIRGAGSFNGYVGGRKSNHTFNLKGTYDLKDSHLGVEDLSLSSSLIGAWHIEGEMEHLLSDDADMELSAEGTDIPLQIVESILSVPATADSSKGFAVVGSGSTSFTVKGGLKFPVVSGSLHLDGRGLTAKDISLGSFTAEVSFGFERGQFMITDGLLLSKEGLIIKREDYGGQLPDLSGSLSLRVIPEEGVTGVEVTAGFNTTGGSFSSSDDSILCEGLDAKIGGDIRFSLPFDKATFDMRAEATGFELLMGRFYSSFKKKEVNLELGGGYSSSDDTLEISGAELSLADIGRIVLKGRISDVSGSRYLKADIRMPDFNNGNAFDFFLKETFKESLPFLAETEAGGSTSMSLSVEGTTESFNITGELTATEAELLGRDPAFSVEGLNIYLPVNLAYPESESSVDEGHFGSLAIRGIGWGDVRIEDIQAAPAIHQNALMFRDDIVIPVFGGKITLHNIQFDDVFSHKGHAHLSIHIDSIDLGKASRALALPEIKGNLSGSIPEAGIRNNSLITRGEITLKLFGGTVKARDLSINHIFSSIPSIKTSISIDNINLDELTATFETGNISGVMRGYVNELVVTKGQAERFETFIETVPAEGISQWISVMALKKITILGGSPTSVLNRGIYRLFKKYRYEKIGFRGRLRNDLLLLQGIQSVGDRQYIIKGGLLPPKVDVINYTQNVSFQEMVQRLKRVSQMQ